jgi:phage portal protein BeeE
VSLFFGKPEARNMDWWAAGIDTTPPSGGRLVSEHTASRLIPVFAAWRHIVDFGSTLPLDCYYEQSDDTLTPAPTPALLRNQDAPGAPGVDTWIGQALFGIVAHGNAVGMITATDGYGFPVDVVWQAKEHWSYDQAARTWLIKGAPIPSSSVLHIPWIVPGGHVLGLSPLEIAATSIGAGLSAQEYSDIKRGGGIPPTILKNNQIELDTQDS